MADKSLEVKKDTRTVSERFTDKIIAEFNGSVSGALQVSEYQRNLIRGYFIGIDKMLKTQEENRIRRNDSNKESKYNNDLPMVWENVNLNDLALDVVHYARMGVDMMEKNHISPIPFKNSKTNKYDITLMIGYNGIEYVARKYALDPPVDVITELVYSTDKFTPKKKSASIPYDDYEFEIVNPFDRGTVIGGFGYIKYGDQGKNKLVIMPLKDILKRKPQKASAEFWGGTKSAWENGKKTETEVAGWFDEMCLKTVKREVFSEKHIPRDPRKIDDDYQYMLQREARAAEQEAQAEIDQNANNVVLHLDGDTGEVLDEQAAPPADDLP